MAIYVPFEQLPANHNPEQGWLATANQKIISVNDPNPLTGDWEMPTRFHRIVDLIQSKSVHSLDDMKVMQGDTLSLGATPLLDLFKSSQSPHPLNAKAMEIGRSFDGDMKVDSVDALIFHAWADQLTRNLFSRLNYLFSENYGSRNDRALLLNQAQNPNSLWCDDPKTEQVETCQESSNNALDQALDYLSNAYGNDPSAWNWDNAHIAISAHRPFSKVPLLRNRFNIRTPFPGDSFTVNVGRLELLQTNNPYQRLHRRQVCLPSMICQILKDRSSFIKQVNQAGCKVSFIAI